MDQNLKLVVNNEHLGWDTIESVEDVGVLPVIGLEVEDTNNHVTEGVLTHNTQIISVALPLYLMGKDPSVRIKMVCLSDDSAKERLASIRAYIEHDPDYQALFPEIRPGNKTEWTRHKLFIERPTFAKDATVDAKGIITTAIGGRCDVLIVDDIFDQRTAVSQPATREQYLATYAQVWLSRVEPDSNKRQVVVICTRWHEHDLLGFVTADKKMMSQYAILVQRVADDFESIECEVFVRDELKEDYINFMPYDFVEK